MSEFDIAVMWLVSIIIFVSYMETICTRLIELVKEAKKGHQ